ncbi:hypothetical protein WICPIJ_005382, partial [Wickerhamomyces pijperi]
TLKTELSGLYGIELDNNNDNNATAAAAVNAQNQDKKQDPIADVESSAYFLVKKDSTEVTEKLKVDSFDDDLEAAIEAHHHVHYDTDDDDSTEKVDDDLIARLKTLFKDIGNLKAFIALNHSGLVKICKKFDKAFGFQEQALINNFREEIFCYESASIFNVASVTRLEEELSDIAKLYHFANYYHCVNKPEFGLDQANAIRNHLDGYAANQNVFDKQHVEHSDNFQWTYSHFKIRGRILPFPTFFLRYEFLTELAIVVITLILSFVKTLEDKVQAKAVAYSFFMCANWAFAPMPLFMVSLSAPLVGVLFQICKTEDGSVITRSETANIAFQSMWSSTIMILISGFTMATALKKYNIAKFFAGFVLRKCGKSPRIIILLLMLIACYLSMFISNVATPVLCFGLAEDMLQDLGANSPLAKAIALGIAFAANIGGMASPISSPQNIVGMQYLQPYGVGWGSWLAVALPCSLICIMFIWGLICSMFNFKGEKIKQQKAFKLNFGIVEAYIFLVCAVTIALWCTSDQVAHVFGNSGVVGIIPMLAFFSVGILNKNDFVCFPWDIVGLAMGSLVFGKLITLSGLLGNIASSLEKHVGHLHLFAVTVIFDLLMLVIGTFVSHTVSAIVLIPLVQQVGARLSAPHAAEILIFQMALLASCGMALPSSGFPNVTAISQLDKKKRAYL